MTFATQTNSFVLLDAADQPLTPLILWPDARAKHLEPEVHRRSSLSEFTATTGVPQLGFGFMVAKLLWLQAESPEIWKRTAKVCLISDYLTFLMTGRHATEAGAAGLTGLLDIHRCQWWPPMLDRFGIEASRLPVVVRAGVDLGAIFPQAAAHFGLPASCRFIVGCLDQYAGAIGVGNVEPEMISETTGTVLATVRCDDRFSTRLAPTVFQGPAFRPGLYWRMAFGETSANYLQWFRDQLSDRPEFEQLTALAESIMPGANGLHLRMGAPMTVPESVFAGLTSLHTQGHMVRCILEAVAQSLNDQIEALSNGFPPREIRCAGGAARSDLWLQIKADLLNAVTVATKCSEPTSLGAAILARASLDGVAVSLIAGKWTHLQAFHLPDPQRHRQYQSLRIPIAG